MVFYLQKAWEAKRAYASIVNVGTQYFGNRPGSYLDADVTCMENYLTDFLKTSGVDANSVEYIETYGCGIKVIINHIILP